MEKSEIGHVTGQVANEINNHAPVTFVANYSSPPPPPSRLVQKMRELMPRSCHEQLDWLLNNRPFSEWQIYWACKLKGLVAPEGLLRQSRAAPADYFWSMTFAVMAGLMLLACLLLLAAGPQWQAGLAAFATAVVMAGAMCTSLAMGVWPHETARKAVQALQQRPG